MGESVTVPQRAGTQKMRYRDFVKIEGPYDKVLEVSLLGSYF